jgi:hypothetical protein
MNTFKESMLRLLQQRSDNRAGMLSRQYLTAEPHEREAIMADIAFEKWLSQVCDDCMD